MRNIVYHYTSPNGILDILQSKKLRFTDCQYLNDKSEFIYFCEPFKEAWEKIEKKRIDMRDDINHVIEQFLESPYEYLSVKASELKSTKQLILNFTQHRYYVFCASKNSDTANMWNYYIKNNGYQGYNLGIDIGYVRRCFEKYKGKQVDFFCDEVVYDRKVQVEIIYKELMRILAEHGERKKGIIDHETHTIEFDTLMSDIYSLINKLKLFFKNPAFSSEEEYRFILAVENDFSESSDLALQFRVGKSGIITPFIEWNYTTHKKPEKLFSQITLAPMIEPELAEESFKRLLGNTSLKKIPIKQSSIKLRF